MRESAFVPSHRTGVPSGLTDLTPPLIVNQSLEQASSSVREDKDPEVYIGFNSGMLEELPMSMSNHGIASMAIRERGQPYRASQDGVTYLPQNQSQFLNSALHPTALDSSQVAQHNQFAGAIAPATGTNDTHSEYEASLEHCHVKAASWGPQQGVPGTKLQCTLLSPFRINLSRPLSAFFGRDVSGTVCTLWSDSGSRFRYTVTTTAPTPQVTQWSNPKTAPSLSLSIPIEGTDSDELVTLGTFTYLNLDDVYEPAQSGLARKRRASSSAFTSKSLSIPTTHEGDLGHDRNRQGMHGQLPDMKPEQHSSSILQGAAFDSGESQDDYITSNTASSHHYAPSVVPSYAYSATCTPPTPSWTSSTTSNLGFETPTNAFPISNDNSTHRKHTASCEPTFIRPKVDQITAVTAPSSRPSSADFNPYRLYPGNKAVLNLIGDLNAMTRDWSIKERQDKRRLVEFTRRQEGSIIYTNFKAVGIDETRDLNANIISCIWNESSNDFYVTSVDTISLLEKLVMPGGGFTVEEKNRIRRNLEGFHPETISKSKPSHEAFFKQIMNFPPPKPRRIEKDVKVFKWNTLATSLQKIISKYIASYSSTRDATRPATSGYHDNAAHLQASDISPRSNLPLSYPSSIGSTYRDQQQLSFSAPCNTFSDGYSRSYQSYSSPNAVSYYSPYTSQLSYSRMQDSNPMIIPASQRQLAGFGSYLDKQDTFIL